ncbi:MAG TPA: hypothetical protein VFY28_01280 [Candidatus Paceibacterota bacterium]|nr:hypothetical protein [Candidatus Paceibacterota bacterium]
MKKITAHFLLLVLAFSATVSIAVAQSTGFDATKNPLSSFMLSIIQFINSVLVPFIFALAFIVFLWGVFQAFILGGANEEKRDEGKKFILWSLIAFFIMTSLWGIVNLFVGTFGFGGQGAPCVPTFGSAEPCETTSRPAPESQVYECPPGATCIPGTNIPEGIY